MEYEVVVQFDPETGGFTATVVDMPIVVDADSEDEAVQMAREAIGLYLEEAPHAAHHGSTRVVRVRVGA